MDDIDREINKSNASNPADEEEKAFQAYTTPKTLYLTLSSLLTLSLSLSLCVSLSLSISVSLCLSLSFSLSISWNQQELIIQNERRDENTHRNKSSASSGSYLPVGATPKQNGVLSPVAAEFWFPECRNCPCCKGNCCTILSNCRRQRDMGL